MTKKNYQFLSKTIFYAIIGIFVLLVCYFSISFAHEVKRKFFLVAAVLGLIFLILGVLLIVFAVKSRFEKKLKVFLILTGASAIGPLVGSVLHNVFYAFAILTEHITVLHYIFEFVHAAFFIIALLVCPAVFLVGVIGTIVLLRKRK